MKVAKSIVAGTVQAEIKLIRTQVDIKIQRAKIATHKTSFINIL